jgi:VWFA-related protein
MPWRARPAVPVSLSSSDRHRRCRRGSRKAHGQGRRAASHRVGLGVALGALWSLLIPWTSAGAGLRAAPPAPPAGTFSESTEVTAVQVPVQVVRGGEPVRGLSAADFEVYDGKSKQKVTGFEVLDLAARQGPAVGSIPPALRRHFLLLFDLSFSEPKSIVKARQMARGMLPALHPSDLVAVATYSSADGPRLVVGFTSDRRQVLKAIDHLGLPQLVDRNADPLQLVAADEAASAPRLESVAEVSPKQAMEAALVDFLASAARAADSADRRQRQQVVESFVHSVTDLARLMASVQGRKEVIYLSEGFDSSLLHGVESIESQAEIADQSIKGEGYLTDSDTRYGSTKGANVLEKMLDELRRADCVIQAVDIGGVRATGDQGLVRPSGEGTLFAMAHDTGGELYRNFNDLGTAMGQVLKNTSVTYVLTFQPDEIKLDGSYHKLRVTLKNGRGAQLFFRSGYYAPRPYRQQSAGERRLAAAEAVVAGGDGGVLRTSVLAVPFPPAGSAGMAADSGAGRPAGSVGMAAGSGADPPAGSAGMAADSGAGPPAGSAGVTAGSGGGNSASGRAYVPVVIEADGAGLLNGSPGETMAVEVYGYAIDSAGAIQDFFSQSLRFELAKVIPLLDRTGLKFLGHFDLPPGEYSVRTLVRNVGNGDYGLRSQPLVVPAFDKSAPVLLPPFFPELPGRWLMVREAARGTQKEAPYPFVVRDRVYVPALRPVLAAAQEVAVALMGYNLPAGALKAEARVLSAQGMDLGSVDFTLDGREPPDAGGMERLNATFRPPRGLEPGEYQLVIVLTGAQGAVHNSATRFLVGAPSQGARG